MKILLPVDGSPFTKHMLAWLATHEQWLSAPHEYTVLTVVPTIPPHAASMFPADQLKSYYEDTGEAVFTGNVLIGQGEMRLSAQSVTVAYAEGGQNRIRSLNATGGVTLVSGPDAAEAAEAAYDVEKGTVVLTGDAIVTRGESVLAGDRIEVSLKDGTASVQGGVRTVLQPGAN